MPNHDLELSTPESFPVFPYDPPYSIQLELMKHLYASLESRKVAVLESPTGTGKTLSLLCGSLTWLKDDQERSKKGRLAAMEESLRGDSNEPAWVLKQALEAQKREMEDLERALGDRLERARKKEEALRRKENGRVRKRAKLSHTTPVNDNNDIQYLPDDESGGDNDYSHLSKDVQEMLRKYEVRNAPQVDALEENEPTCTKIFYASRTHTQLSQTISELQKTTLGPTTRAVPLGSRKNMCINDELRSKAGDLDEACRELMSGKSGHRCPYMPAPGEESRLLEFRDHILATPRDIEDTVELGKDLNTCPYYGSRKAIPQAEACKEYACYVLTYIFPQLVILPYNLLLQKNSREALGIDLKDHIVIVDEAHNLIDTILSIYTVPLSSTTLRASLSQLKIYLSKFRTRLSPKNALHLRRLVLFLTSMDKFLADWLAKSKSPSEEEMLSVQQFVEALGSKVQEVNLLEIDKYLRESKIARKVSGYCEKVAEEATKDDTTKQSTPNRRGRPTPPLHSVESFLLALTTPSKDGRIFVSRTQSSDVNKADVVHLKYQLLNPSDHFQEVVSAARSVILAGGTMQPISDLQTQLFSSLEGGELNTFSCGHVIPKNNLKCVVVEKGPRGRDMTFRFEQRGDRELMVELGQLLKNFVNVIPSGVVVFFPSYAFLNNIKKVWEENGVLEQLAVKKKIFFEPQDNTDVESVLREYAETIRGSKNPTSTGKVTGSILFAVVGAKLSEGLNFSDDLARAVILVGMPFANLGSVELKERMKYVTDMEKQRLETTGTKLPPGTKDAGQELYENLCMKAVNQSIGRAIRHRGDWAALILLDVRYSSQRIRAKLPKWIAEDIVVAKSFGQAMGELGSFYREKKMAAT